MVKLLYIIFGTFIIYYETHFLFKILKYKVVTAECISATYKYFDKVEGNRYGFRFNWGTDEVVAYTQGYLDKNRIVGKRYKLLVNPNNVYEVTSYFNVINRVTYLLMGFLMLIIVLLNILL